MKLVVKNTMLRIYGIGNGGWPGLGFDIGAVGTSEIQQGFLRCMLAFASIPRREFSDVKDALHEGEYSKRSINRRKQLLKYGPIPNI